MGTGTINIGTAGHRTINAGNILGATAMTLKSGTGGIDLAATGAGNVVISDGNLGIDQGSPSYALHIGSTGDSSGAVSNAWNTFSDRRLKKDILDLPISMAESLMKLAPVSFNWKATNRSDIGFIAQEVEKLLPHVVTTGTDGLKAVDYPRIGVYTVKALQQVNSTLAEKIAAQEAKLTIADSVNVGQDAKIAEHDAKDAAHEATIAALEAKFAAKFAAQEMKMAALMKMVDALQQ